MKTLPMKSFHFYKVLNNVTFYKKDALIEHEILYLINKTTKKIQGLQFLILIQLTSKESQQCNYALTSYDKHH